MLCRFHPRPLIPIRILFHRPIKLTPIKPHAAECTDAMETAARALVEVELFRIKTNIIIGALLALIITSRQ